MAGGIAPVAGLGVAEATTLGWVEFVDLSELSEPPPKAADKIAAKVVPDELADEVLMPRLIWAIEEQEIQGFLQMPPELAEIDNFEQEQLEIVFLYDSTVSLSEKAFDRFEQAMEIIRHSGLCRNKEAGADSQDRVSARKR